MFRKVLTRIHEAEQRWSASYGTDISTPALRRQAWWHFHLADHGFLRVLWTRDGLSQRELSERGGMMEPTTVIALRSREKAGLIRRVRSTGIGASGERRLTSP